MSEISESGVAVALTFKVQQKVGWSVQRGDQSWAGRELAGLEDCLIHKGDRPMTLSLSLIFELPRNDGTVRT